MYCEKSPAPKEGDTRPFIDTKATFKQLKERHAIFKKKVQQDREDGSADNTGIYSMNEADVTKPLEKSSAPSYKTLRAVKLPDGKKVNVYGNNGYERISNGPHRGRYLHSVMAEHKLGRKLKGNEEIDHKNGDRKANGLSNLRLTTTSQHAAHTNTERAKQGGFTGEKRYMHSREYTEGKPENMEKADLGQVSEPKSGFNPDNMFAPEAPAPTSNIKNVIAKLQAKNNNEKMFESTVNELKAPPPAPQSSKPDLSNFTAKYRMRKSKK
jgi:hypothetical protein